MFFETMRDLKLWLKIHKKHNFDGGSQGECYRIGNKVYKIFIQFIEDEEEDMIVYNRDEILRFSSLVNKTYIFPIDVIIVGDLVVGYITDYVDAISLYKINPLGVNLDLLEKDLKIVYSDIGIISDKGICSYDVLYNIMYGMCGFKIIDTIEYTYSQIDYTDLYRINVKNFTNGIKLFLIDGYFDQFVSSNRVLYDMYSESSVDIMMFIREFRKKLSENEGYNVTRLSECSKSISIKRVRSFKYIREI